MVRKRPSTDIKQCSVSTGNGLGDRTASIVEVPFRGPVFKETKTNTAAHDEFTTRRTSSGESQHVIKGTRGMKIPGLVEGTPLEFQIDTGAINTFITEDTYYSILPENRPVLERALKKFHSADGGDLNVIGTAIMLLSFGDLDIHFRVFEGKMKCNLLGQDFMEEFRGIWDYETTSLVLTCSCVLGKRRNKMNKSSRVMSVEDCDIPAGHEAIVKGRLASRDVYGEGVLVPLKKFIHEHGIMVAHALISVKNNEIDVLVRVFNPSDNDVKVKKNTYLALFSPVLCSSASIPENVYSVNTTGVFEELPDHLCDLYKDGCKLLSPEQSQKFRRFLIQHQTAFTDPNKPMERARIGEHSIKLKDDTPFKEPPRKVTIFKREILDKEIGNLLEDGLIEKSNSPWSSPLVLVQKKDKSWRLCVEYRRLYTRTVKDAYPIPRMSDDLDSLAGSKWFTSLDLNMAYHQIPMNEHDKEKTAFATPRGGLFHYRVMPFGLCNAPATFQRVIEQALNGLQWQVTVLYLDDIIVVGRDFEEHLSNLNLVINRLSEAYLKLKAKKCNFFLQRSFVPQTHCIIKRNYNRPS